MREIDFGEVIFITTRQGLSETEEIPSAIRIIEINPIRSVEEYSRFVLTSLEEVISNPYVLLIQWDGYVITPERWSDEFLSYDYIGAPWPQKDGSKIVGNGGFSLRSKKLLEALRSEGIQYHHPEDDCIAKTNRILLETKYDISFAGPEIAETFSFEFTTPKTSTFGFHGFCHFPDIMSPKDLHHFVRVMPVDFVFNGYFPKFLEQLHNKTLSNPLYFESMSIVQQAVSEAFHQARFPKIIPEKSLIKALIRCNLTDLAKVGIESRINSSGYSATNIRLLTRYLWHKLRPNCK